MSSIYARGSRLWMRVKVDGAWVSRATPYTTSQRAQAQRYAAAAQAAIDERELAGAPTVADTVRAYALGPWLDARRGRARRRRHRDRAPMGRRQAPEAARRRTAPQGAQVRARGDAGGPAARDHDGQHLAGGARSAALPMS